MPQSLRLLLVEDSPDDASLLLRELRRSGYEVTHRHVWTPEDLEAAFGEPYDIAISDWQMPRLNGLSAFRIVRKHDPDLPFIIVSGTIGEEIAVDALQAGVDDFMSKGRFARLAPAIERARDAARMRKQERAAAAELVRKREQIERSEQLLRAVLDSVPDGVLVAGGDHRILACNPAARALLQLEGEGDNLDACLRDLAVFGPDGVSRLSPERRPLAIALGGVSVDRETLVYRTPGGDRYLSVSARPLEVGSGVQGAIAVFRDVSGERSAQEQLMISDRMASVGMLAAGVAHEINNPLAAVLANVDLIASSLAETTTLDAAELTEVREMAEDARDATQRVRQIVKDLKIFSRHEDTEAAAVDLRRMLDSTLRMAWNEIRHRARLIKDFGTTQPVRGTESRLGQVFLNLVVNAAQAIPEGHAESNTIRVLTRTEPRGVIVEVTDTGPGIPLEVKQRLFTPFFTTKKQGEGTGLGLAISHRIITGLGGTIEVDSELGRGTTFRVILPAATNDTTAATAPILRVGATRRARILVIDDEPLVAGTIARILGHEHEVHTLTSAHEALARIRGGESYDVILSDLMMPQMSGMDLYAELVGIGIAERIIFLTGGAFTPAARQFLDRVPNMRIEKPFDRQHLRALINERIR